MSSLAEILLPAVTQLGARARGARARAVGAFVVVAGLAALGSVWLAITGAGAPSLGRCVRLDATSRLFLAVVNPIFLGVSVYVRSRVIRSPALRGTTGRFIGFALAFLLAANVAIAANHFTLLVLALEASTLAAAPLVLGRASPASLRASFRYLLFSSVGLGLASLGLSCVVRGMIADGHAASLFLDGISSAAAASQSPWTRFGLGLVVLGLGTKLGLAPMYTWLPETYDEAPPAVTALLGAVQFNCALVCLFRVLQIFRPAHGPLFSSMLITMGTLSMAVSTMSIIVTRNVKRLIAYASINHAGVIAIGLGVGNAAVDGLLLYVLSNAFIKAILFLTVGHIEAHYRTKDTRRISGLLEHLPYSGVFLMVGTFALLGFPPFGSFLGELLILSALVGSRHMVVFATFCTLITMTFVATGRTIFPMIWGEAKEDHAWPRQTFLSATPKMMFLAALVLLGIYIPEPLHRILQQVAASLGAS